MPATVDPPLLLAEDIRPDGTTVVTASGELDLDTAGDLKAVLDRLAVEQPPTVLDLADITFIDSTGLRVILTAARRAAEDDWSFALVPKLSEPAARLLEITDAYRLLPFAGET